MQRLPMSVTAASGICGVQGPLQAKAPAPCFEDTWKHSDELLSISITNTAAWPLVDLLGVSSDPSFFGGGSNDLLDLV